MCYWIRIYERNRGKPLVILPSELPSVGSVLVWSQGGNAGGLLLAAAGGGGWAAFPWFPPLLFNDLTGVACSWAMWPQPWHQKHWSQLGHSCWMHYPVHFESLGIPLTLAYGWCSAISRYTVGWGGLSQTSLAIMGIGAARRLEVEMVALGEPTLPLLEKWPPGHLHQDPLVP